MKLSFPILKEESHGELCRLKCLVTSSPFVYTFLENETPVYIGKTCDIWGRLNVHLNEDKWVSANSIKIEQMNSCVDMDLYEVQMINKYRPSLNRAIPEGDISGVVEITPKTAIKLDLCADITNIYRKLYSLAKNNGLRLTVHTGYCRVFFKLSGKLVEKGKTFTVSYSYYDKTREFSWDRVSGRKAFDEKVNNLVINGGLYTLFDTN